MQKTVEISNKLFNYTIWEGQTLNTKGFAFDTETELIKEDCFEPPTVALASVSDSINNYLIHPSKLSDFLITHPTSHYIFQNISFDFWVVDEYLKINNHSEARKIWWQIVEDGRSHDTMLLDILYRLAVNDAYPAPRDLAVLGKEYANLQISKDDPYRLRYGELIGKTWNEPDIEPGFWEYAIKDPITTYLIFPPLFKKSKEIAYKHGVSKDTMQKYGVLTEQIQIRGALALTKTTRNGINIDVSYKNNLFNNIQRVINEVVNTFISNPEYRKVFKFNRRSGELEYTQKGAPRTSRKELTSLILSEKSRAESDYNITIPIPTTEKGSVSTSMVEWCDLIKYSPFMQQYEKLIDNLTLSKFFRLLTEEVIHPRYTYLVRTGRISGYSPNLTNIPKKEGMREIFQASENHLLLAIDYKFIELRTLAHILETMYGRSILADTIRNNIDPHEYTGALLSNTELTDFRAMKKTNEKFYKDWRQKAKITNFGLPGGLSANSLIDYARTIYGVHFTFEQSSTYRNKLINDVYPEIGKYLEEDTVQLISDNLNCPVYKFYDKFDWSGERKSYITIPIKNILKGIPYKKDKTPYSADFVNKIWDGLEELNNNESIEPLLKAREPSEELYRTLFWQMVKTTTGRIRGRTSYTQNRNCLDAKTEALTKRGWVSGFDLKLEDEILTKNAETGTLEWHKPIDLKFYPDYEGPLVEFKSKAFSAISTPDHRWLVYNRTTEKNECKLTKDISIHGDHKIHRTGEYSNTNTIYLNDFIKLCGWFLTDGNCVIIPRKTVKDYVRVQLYQSQRANPHKVEKIRKILETLNALGHEQLDKRTECVKFVLKTEIAIKLHDLFPIRTLTSDFLASISREQANILLETMIDGDGCRSYNKETFCCKTELQKDMFQFLCVLAGFSSKSIWRDMSKYKPKSNKLLNIPKMTGIWHTTILKRDKAQIVKNQKIEFFDKQPVWCPIVPNSYFVARRDNKVFITGNSPFQGLAADGGKLALFKLLPLEEELDFKTVGFVHDEIIMDVKASIDENNKLYLPLSKINTIKSVMCETMQTVTGNVPIDGDFTVSKKWSKDAKNKIVGDRVYPD